MEYKRFGNKIVVRMDRARKFWNSLKGGFKRKYKVVQCFPPLAPQMILP